MLVVESVEAGELVPQTTLNRFEREDEEWTLAEKLKIAAKVAVQSKIHCSQYNATLLGDNL